VIWLFGGAAVVAQNIISLIFTSINTPQCRFPYMMLSSGETLTELLVHKSLNEFEQITACSLAQIDVLHNFVLPLHITNQLNGPQAVEKPIQKRNTSSVEYPQPATVIAALAVVLLLFALKLIIAFAVASSVGAVTATLLIYIANVSLGIVIVEFTQQVQTIEQVAVPLAASGARVYLTPEKFNESIGWSKNYYFDMEKDYG
ncbi:MAG: hypothetical protein EZS28_017844, partial [Streblomastix strix]